jgi:hypothetical protein
MLLAPGEDGADQWPEAGAAVLEPGSEVCAATRGAWRRASPSERALSGLQRLTTGPTRTTLLIISSPVGARCARLCAPGGRGRLVHVQC